MKRLSDVWKIMLGVVSVLAITIVASAGTVDYSQVYGSNELRYYDVDGTPVYYQPFKMSDERCIESAAGNFCAPSLDWEKPIKNIYKHKYVQIRDFTYIRDVYGNERLYYKGKFVASVCGQAKDGVCLFVSYVTETTPDFIKGETFTVVNGNLETHEMLTSRINLFPEYRIAKIFYGLVDGTSYNPWFRAISEEGCIINEADGGKSIDGYLQHVTLFVYPSIYYYRQRE